MTKLKANHPEIWKFVKFNISVLITSILDVVSYLFLLYVVFKKYNDIALPNSALLSLLGIKYKGYLFSYLLSTSIGYIAAYLINRKITFHSNINPAYSSVLYFLLAVFNILVSSYIGGVFGSFILERNINTPIVEIVSKFIIINIPTIWTYPIERYIIQIKKKEMKEKIIAVDLDGTLLNSNSAISNENISAIKRLYDNGIKTAILTGRTFYEIPLEVRKCDSIEYFVYSNGAGINQRIKGIKSCSPIPKDTAIKIFDILRSYTCFVELYSNGFPFVNDSEFNYKSLEFYNIDGNFIPVMMETRRAIENIESILYDDAYKIEMFDIFFKYESEKKECEKRLSSELINIELTSSMSNNLEITNLGIDKGYGLRKLCEITDTDIKNVIVIGDSKNDISAFKTANTGFAVSNACPELKRLANKTICSNDENVMCYIEKELL